jgi:hypothetical protein
MFVQTHTRYDIELEEATKRAKLIQEQVNLLNRLREIEVEINMSRINIPVSANSMDFVENKNFDSTNEVENLEVENSEVKENNRGKNQRKEKKVPLSNLIQDIALTSDKPLTLHDFVSQCRKNGYTTNSSDFVNMVYQNLRKLVKKGKFQQDSETRAFELVR